MDGDKERAVKFSPFQAPPEGNLEVSREKRVTSESFSNILN